MIVGSLIGNEKRNETQRFPHALRAI